MEYTAIIEKCNEGGYVAQCAQIKNAFAQGETINEAKENLLEVIKLLKNRKIMYTFTVSVPTKKDFIPIQSYIKDLGVNAVVKEIKSTRESELSQALEDLEKGNLIHYGTVEEFSEKIDKYFT